MDPPVHHLCVQRLQDPEDSSGVHESQAWVVVEVLDVAESDFEAAQREKDRSRIHRGWRKVASVGQVSCFSG
jgi:parvulin-like peptidyl-prolyl isomerase